MLMTLAQAAKLLPGAVLVGNGATAIDRVHSDTRSLRAGDLFVALRGERFDAHDFLPQAQAAGAAAALAERGLAVEGSAPEATATAAVATHTLPGLRVPDTLAALQQLAQAWRAQFTLPVIAVAGSNGKTTVTQMIAGILRQWVGGVSGDGALATAGNLNNHIGLPLSVLRLQPSHRAAVFELGMNHPGEIGLLARIAQPTVAVVNNAQREHQEFMASVEAVARENGAVIAALPADGVAVFPADDAHAPLWRAGAGTRSCLTFAMQGVADVVADARWIDANERSHWALQLRTPAGAATTELHLAGSHNVHNALAAAAAALAIGAPLSAIVSGLQAFRSVAGRSHMRRWKRGARCATLVDDSYNANPDSVRAAITMLARLPGPHWLVLGEMGEVGDQGPAYHAEVGELARAQGLESVWTVGTLCRPAAAAFGAGARHFEDVEALIAHLAEAPACASALVKGSRFMRMERVVAALQANATEAMSHAA